MNSQKALILSIKNEKLSFFNRPIYVSSVNEALSYVQNILMSDSDRALRGLKSDLALYFIGEIDWTTGVISSVNDPEFVCSLEEIFDNIPSDKVLCIDSEIQRKFDALSDEISNLHSTVDKLSQELSCCKKVKK